METTSITRKQFMAGSMGAAVALASAAGMPVAASSAEEAASPTWLGEEPSIGEISRTLETEVLIIGAGNGGTAAAATAAQLGVDFLLAEQFDTVQDTRHWVGGVNTRYTEAAGVEVDVPRLQYELARYASFKCNQRLHKMWIDESAEMISWIGDLQEAEGRMPLFDTNLGDEMEPTCRTGNYVPPLEHMFVDPEIGYAYDTAQILESYGYRPDRNEMFQNIVEEAGNKILWNHTLIRLIHDAGKVTGAIFETADGNVQVNANHVILATGGYPANPDMVKALAPIVPLCVTGANYSPKDRGDGIKAALWAGATMDPEPAPMIFNRGMVAPGTACGYVEDGGDAHFPTTMNEWLGSQPFLKVDANGRRFANESCPYDFICFAATEHPGGVWCQVFDSNMAQDIARFNTAGCSRMAQRLVANGKSVDENYAFDLENGMMFKADTLEELADKLGFEDGAKETFLAEVARYNELYDAQDDADFGKEAYRLSELRTPPFYGGWYGGNLLTTCDGLRIDEEMRVLDANSAPIPGLYAIGDCSGSFFSGNYPEYLVGVAVGRTVTQGRHVIRKIAGDID